MTFQYYLTVFIDLLGQKDSLKKLERVSDKKIDEKEFIESIKNSVGKVSLFRKLFDEYFIGAKSHVVNKDLVAPIHQEDFIASQKLDIIFNGFSDSFIISVPLMNNDENCTAMNGIFAAFGAICGLGLCLLSVGVPCRAGLDVGLGTQINDREIYGLSLERAYYLENCLAEYPRYLIGEELVNYLVSIENQKPTTPFGLIAKNLASECKKMIIRDTDGRLMLDFMGNVIRETNMDSIDKETVLKARDFITSMYQKYIDENNYKLSSRYYRLIAYFNSRKQIWGII